MRILCLVTDAFGGHGGISKFNRDLLTSICTHNKVTEVVAIPRIMPNPPGVLPRKLKYVLDGLNSKSRYLLSIISTLLRNPKFDLIVCGHINLVPFAWLCRRCTGARIALVIHGIDAWHSNKSSMVNTLVGKIDALISVSEYTRTRIREWANVRHIQTFILPNCVDFTLFAPGAKDTTLVQRYNIQDKVVLMTLGRLDSKERAKGFDEVMQVLPQLAQQIPNICYLIVGGGCDRSRLEEKAVELGIKDRVVFADLIPEAEKVAHYHLADAYIMPSRGEGFGIVFLEAMACGIPVVGSTADGSREALRNGMLGLLVDPANPEELVHAITSALGSQRQVPDGLEYFSSSNFEMRVHEFLNSQLEGKS